ncbi:MAG: SusD/RagB family nutrient-binding outer membrane lipoprotein, partial [Chloroflexota bacterium]
MKTNILKYILSFVVLVVMAVGCTKDYKEINTDPNRPKEVPTVNLISTAEKSLTDDIFDEWFSGRQGLLWSQFWAQRNYTEEDRFIIRQNTNNTYWRLIYTDMMDLQQIINIASDPAKVPGINAYYGDAVGQVAVANILKSYVFQLLASTYGDVPYEEAFDAVNNPTPAYSSQKVIYLDLFAKLKAAADYLETSGTQVFTSGDLIYDGDPQKWAKFANSL